MRFLNNQEKTVSNKAAPMSRASTQTAFMHYLSLASLVSMTIIFLLAISV
jgi:hypothetical protein